jgi:hypothetical protein
MMHTPASSPRSFPAPAGEVSAQSASGGEGASCPSPRPAGRWSAAGGSEGSSPLLPRASGGGAEQREAEGVFSSYLPRPTVRWSASGGTDGVFSPSGCHGLTRRATRAPSSPSASHHSNAQVVRRARVVHLRRSNPWHPKITNTLPSPRGVAGETSPAQASHHRSDAA